MLKTRLTRTIIHVAIALSGLVAIPTAVAGQWVRATVPDSLHFHLRGVDFANDSLGFAVGGRAIMKSEDGGRSWAVSDTVTFNGVSLSGVTTDSTIIGNVTVVVGSDLTIGRSSNEGASWRTVYTGLGAMLNTTCAQGNGMYSAFGEGAWLAQSNDNALSWGSGLVFPSADMNTATCLPDGTIWAGGFWANGGVNQCCGVLMKSIDNGNTWMTVIRPTTTNDGNFVDIQFVTDDVGYTISSTGRFGGKSIFWRTMDGGDTWERLAEFERLNALQFADEKTGIMVGENGIILATVDGGDTWSKDTLFIPVHLYDITFAGKTAVLVGDAGGFYYENYVTTAAQVDAVPSAGRLAVETYPNPAVHEVTFTLSADAVSQTPTRIRIFDVLGRVVKDETLGIQARSATVALDGLPTGLYFYQTDLDGRSASGSLMLVK